MVQNSCTSRFHLLQVFQQAEGLVAVEGLLAGPEEEAVREDVPGQGLTRKRGRQERGREE